MKNKERTLCDITCHCNKERRLCDITCHTATKKGDCVTSPVTLQHLTTTEEQERKINRVERWRTHNKGRVHPQTKQPLGCGDVTRDSSAGVPKCKTPCANYVLTPHVKGDHPSHPSSAT
ncbi:hypothetical protein NDU88_004907 [Pleurodeles waltl]|uniref:Uncharacterized protein n=1 Tax=Pleurodeles waltl TaxID=8319 RepID=A0AAV7SK54_PLEWA|nr:hypothetical protein NDU88_004907 [Pleurodeles waltl]